MNASMLHLQSWLNLARPRFDVQQPFVSEA